MAITVCNGNKICEQVIIGEDSPELPNFTDNTINVDMKSLYGVTSISPNLLIVEINEI